MKLTIILVLFSFASFAQQIGTSQIKDAAVTQSKLGAGSVSNAKIATGAVTTDKIADQAVTVSKLDPNALLPVSGGTLPIDGVLTFDEFHKQYTTTVTANLPLTLASSGHTAGYSIIINATGDGTHVLTFDPAWRITGTYNANAVQEITLKYHTGGYVTGTIEIIADIVVPTLSTAEVPQVTPTSLNLTFSAAVSITDQSGWTLEGESTVQISSVSGSGTTAPTFTLNRAIDPGEDLTISYDPVVGNTTSLTGNELAQISAFTVETGEPPVVPDQTCDFTCDTEAEITTAAATATTGQKVCISNGTYRITITPTNNGVIFENTAGHTPIISGLNTISDGAWSVHSGSIYKATVSLPVTGFDGTLSSNTDIQANQIFDGGEMQIQAQYPNAANKEALFLMSNMRHQSLGTNLVTGNQGTGFQPTSVTDVAASTSSLGTLTGGGVIFINGWYLSGTRTITAHSGNVITWSPAYSSNTPINNVNFRKWWKVTNKLSLLDIAREWHYEGGILYLFAQGGGSPTGIEYKARNWGFNLENKSGITIKGLTLIGCEVRGNTSTTNCTIDNIRASYTNHVFLVSGSPERTNMEQTGFRLIGSGNTIKNSEFNWGASNCIWLGTNGIAQNNLITNYGYEGNYGAGVSIWGGASGWLVERNTISGMGRSCVDFSMTWDGSNLNGTIRYNDLFDYCKINNDGGAIYTARRTNTTGLVVDHNWIHDAGWVTDPQGIRIEGGWDPMYMDQGTGPLTFHHNVLWNNAPSIDYQDFSSFYIRARDLNRQDTPASLIYNNTFEDLAGNARHSYKRYITEPNDIQKNNIYNGGIVANWGGNQTTGAPPGGTTAVSNSILQNQTPVYLNTGTGGLIYRPASGSALQVNAGTSIPGITDNAVGAPDAGAYEFGAVDAAWVPGYVAVTANDIDATAANGVVFSVTGVAGATATWELPSASEPGWFGSTISYSFNAGATAKFSFTGTKIRIYAERLATHGTGTITIDGGAPATLDFNDTPYGLQKLIYESGTLSAASHNVVITVSTGVALFDYYSFDD